MALDVCKKCVYVRGSLYSEKNYPNCAPQGKRSHWQGASKRGGGGGWGWGVIKTSSGPKFH